MFLLPVAGVAQSNWPRPGFEEPPSRVVVFGGYSYMRNNGNGFGQWEGQGTYNFMRHVGVTADVTGGSINGPGSLSFLGFSGGLQQHTYTYLFGPTVSTNLGRKSSLFAHALFGEAHSSLGAGVSFPIIGGISTGVTSSNAFAMAFGGGVDLGLTKHIALRAAQVDLVRTQFNATDALTAGLSTSLNNRQNSLRYSAGVVIRF
ncbi:MAG: hypothetical protein JO187_13945 [Acidobacteria bacterium]|nr:hypothetical protein [Acidobacteriota bacterium]